MPGTNGSILIADESNNRLIEMGYALNGTAESGQLDCGLPGVRKQFTNLSLELDVPGSTSAVVEYSLDNGPWKLLTQDALPPGTYGTLIRYRVSMSTTRRDATPRLLGVSIGYEPAPEGAAGGTGAGAGSSGGSGSGSGTGTGSGGGGTMAGESNSAAGAAVSGSSVVTGPLTTQRGWTMARVGPTILSEGPIGGGGGPAPALGGLLLLGTVYTAGMLSVPVQRQLGTLLHRPQTAP